MTDDIVAPKVITAEQREQYEEDGVLCLRGAFELWIERLRVAIQKNIENPGPLATGKQAAACSSPRSGAARIPCTVCTTWP